MGGLEWSQEALEVAERAIELDSDSSFALQQRNRALSGLGRSQEALEAAERFVEPDSAQFLSKLTASAKRNARCFSTEQLSPTKQGVQG
jgi:hypothetical protein